MPTQSGTNLAANRNFALSLTGWVNISGCVTWDGTVTHTADGSGSAKVSCTTGASKAILEQVVTIGSDEEIVEKFWIKTDAAFNGLFSYSFFDSTDGSGSILAQSGPCTTEVSSNSDWVQIGCGMFPSTQIHAGDSVRFEFLVSGQTAGNAWVDDGFIGNSWYPLRDYDVYPNSDYVWTDKAPIEKNLHNAFAGISDTDLCPSPAIGMICGFAEIDPPPGQTLSTLTLTEQICTVSDCSSGVLATKPFASPLAVQPWAFTPTDYNGGVVPANGTVVYRRGKLTVTSGGALVASYPARKEVFEDATFRSGLVNWFDVDAAWMHGGVRKFPFGVYDRLSGTNRCSVCIWSATNCGQSTVVNTYLYCQQGPGTNSVAPASAVLGHGPSNIATYAAAKFNFIMGDIVGMSTVCPTSLLCSGDQLSPFLDALNQFGSTQMQIVNNWYHCVIGEAQNTPCPAPTAPSGLAAGTGSITASTLWVKYTYTYHFQPAESSQYPMQEETFPSAATSISLSGAACAGVNCSVSWTTPACPSRASGVYIYTSTNNITYTRQYPPVTGAFVQTASVPCSTAVTLTSLLATNIPPPGTAVTISNISRVGSTVTITTATPFFTGGDGNDNNVSVSSTDTTDFPPVTASVTPVSIFSFTYGQSGTATSSSGGTVTVNDPSSSGSPTWQNAHTDSGSGGVWSAIAAGMINPSHEAGSAGIYCCDEPLLDSLPSVWYQEQTIRPAANGMPVWGTLVDGTGPQFWRDVLDIIGSDPYPLGAAADPDDFAAAPGVSARSCNDYTTGFNVVAAATNCFPQRIPIWVDNDLRETGGTKPVWETLQLFLRGSHSAMTYPSLYEMALTAIISERNWGNMGGIDWWGWVSSLGMESAWFSQHNTNALSDFYLMSGQINALAPVLMTDPSDSPILSGGTGQVDGASGETVTGGQVLSNVKLTTTTVSTDCGAASVYSNATNYPFGEVRFFTVKYPVPNTNLVDQYIFANNLCNSSPTVQFTLANPPAGATTVEVLNAGRTIPISGGTFTDTWNDAPTGTTGFGVYVYVIRTPRGTVIH
ncbi:MAG: hypothetical protein ACYDCM_00670 [Candidatus Acidiferrales bacterium]